MDKLLKNSDKLSGDLIDHVAKQLFVLQGEKSPYAEPDIVTWLAGAAVHPIFKNIDVAMNHLVKNHRIKLNNFVFGEWDDSNQPLWLDVLGRLRNIYFEQCEFECSKLSLNNVATWYDGCRFGKPWFVTMGKNPDALIEAADPVYNTCEFSGVVSLNGDEVDEETLGLYGVVFQDCRIESLYVSQITLTTRLYVAPSQATVFLSQDRHGTPKTLEDFLAISVVFKKEFDLNHLHVESIQLSRCNFEEGVNLSGFVCDILNLDSCNVDGRFNFDRAHATKVGFSDCHFKRSVILDSSSFDVLLLKASSFEQILSLENAELSDCIDIGSCSMSKPPNFLNCQLSDEVIRTADRETFRIIKNSFDAVGNLIEANRYFSYEMNAYLKELRQKPQGRRAERWLVELNSFISDHGQNYWKPLRLILVLPVLYGLVLDGYQEQWLYGLDSRVDLVLDKASQYANQYASNFGISLPKRAEGVEFMVLLLGLALSGLLWHFLVAVRRHKRR